MPFSSPSRSRKPANISVASCATTGSTCSAPRGGARLSNWPSGFARTSSCSRSSTCVSASGGASRGGRWDRNVPVILLAPSSDPVERVRALDRGADDVMGRPFAYEELLARIRALLRRSTTSTAEVLLAGELVVDRRTRRVSVRETLVGLSAKEFELLAWLAAEPYRVFTKEELLREVWGYRALGRTRTLESHASRLRKKLRLAEDDHFIVNIWGVGYRLLE